MFDFGVLELGGEGAYRYKHIDDWISSFVRLVIFLEILCYTYILTFTIIKHLETRIMEGEIDMRH